MGMERRTDGSVRAGTGKEAASEEATGKQTFGSKAAGATIVRRYLAATVATVVALAGMALLRRIPDADAPFLLAMAPVVFACWFGGLGPGLFAATLVAV